MTDRRELILQRLVAIAAAVDGVILAERNNDEMSEHKRPAIAIFDADEEGDEALDRRSHAGEAPALVAMTPGIEIKVGAAPEAVGSELNLLRSRLIKAVLTDMELRELLGSNGRARYLGCTTELGRGRSMEGTMQVHLAFTYVLRPSEL